MAAAKKKSTRASSLPPIDLPNNIFKSTTDLSEGVALIASLRRERDTKAADLNERISELQIELAEAIEPFDRKIAHLASGVKYFADQNKAKLLEGESKTIKLPTGHLSYRSQPMSVKTKSSTKLVDKILEQNEMSDWWAKIVIKLSKVFLRVKLELDKDACLKNKNFAKEKLGIEFNETEEKFYIKPAEMDEIEVIDAAA
jgi:phage host-nuclease inhibitor protein Gam